MKQDKFLSRIEVMQRCQRNFDFSKSVSREVVEYLYKIGHTTPTKQNLNSFQLVAFTKRDQILEIAKTATSVYDLWDPEYDDKEDIKAGRRIQNPQVNATVLFMYFLRPESKTSKLRQEREGITGDSMKYWRSTTNFEMGLSASAISMAAISMGMKTGFCRCFNRDMLAKIVEPYGLHSDDFSTALGIGYPIEGVTHYVHTDLINVSETLPREKYIKMIF